MIRRSTQDSVHTICRISLALYSPVFGAKSFARSKNWTTYVVYTMDDNQHFNAFLYDHVQYIQTATNKSFVEFSRN